VREEEKTECWLVSSEGDEVNDLLSPVRAGGMDLQSQGSVHRF
jgi:hypothetical protein